MKLNYHIATLILIILSICLVNALDSSTPLVCGGDNETVILCLSSETINFFGYDFPEEGGGFGSDTEPYETHTLPTPTPPIVLEPFLLLGIIDISFLRKIGLEPEDLWLIYGILIIFILCICLYIRKRKCDKCKKRFRYKDLTKYKEKHYCNECLKKVKS